MKKASDSNLDFDGMTGNGVNRGTNRFAGNQHMKTNPDALINKGRGPTKGNTDSTANTGARPPASAVPANIKIKNPDYINGGAQVRTPGGTRAWDPKGTQNYRGNADSINVGRGPTKGNQQ